MCGAKRRLVATGVKWTHTTCVADFGTCPEEAAFGSIGSLHGAEFRQGPLIRDASGPPRLCERSLTGFDSGGLQQQDSR